MSLHRKKTVFEVVLGASVAFASIFLAAYTSSAFAFDAYMAETQEQVSSEYVLPDSPSALVPAKPLSPEDRALLEERLFELRESYDKTVDNYDDLVPQSREAPDSVPPADEETGEGAVEDLSEYLATPSQFFYIAKQNPRAKLSGGSTLAEPSAITEGKRWLAAGNTHVEYSVDVGNTWTNIPIPAGPSNAPNACCDIDMIYDRALGLTFYSVLYLNSAATDGAVRIFVRRNNNSGLYACSYTFNPAGIFVPDYPHLGLSDNHLYLTLNNGGASNAQVRRYGLYEMGECIGTPVQTYTYPWTYGQRVIVPIEGATDTMYWGLYQTSNTFRVYKWPEGTSTITSIARAVNTESFTNPDCRGGVGNNDFIERSTAWSITGFRMRGALSRNNGLLFLTNVNTISSSRPYAHLAAVRFKESDLSLIDQPDVWGGAGCFGYPALTVNDRGDYGLSVAYGGGTTGTAAQGYVLMDDIYTSGIRFGPFTKTSTGTHNRSDGRYGDYFTARRGIPCGLDFTATNYSLNGGTGVGNVNSMVIQFARGRDDVCWRGWKRKARRQ